MEMHTAGEMAVQVPALGTDVPRVLYSLQLLMDGAVP